MAVGKFLLLPNSHIRVLKAINTGIRENQCVVGPETHCTFHFSVALHNEHIKRTGLTEFLLLHSVPRLLLNRVVLVERVRARECNANLQRVSLSLGSDPLSGKSAHRFNPIPYSYNLRVCGSRFILTTENQRQNEKKEANLHRSENTPLRVIRI